MRLLVSLAWQDLRASGRRLWIFCACLVLGVSLVTAGGGLYRQIADALASDAKLLFGGDVEVEARMPVPADVLAWMEARGTVSRMVELRTMLRQADGRAQLIDLQSADARYPLYGTVTLEPDLPLDDALRHDGTAWGAAVDGALATRLGLQPGDRVEVGGTALVVRAVIARQPDRSLRADWSGAPVLVADGALEATGLVQPQSQVEYRYRVRTDDAATPTATATAWRDALTAAHPGLDAEVETFEERSERLAEVLGQIGSGLLLIGFSALFIGGLGVFNSVQAYLQGKLTSLATLRALGLRDRRLAAFVLLQIVMLAVLASLAGVLLGTAFALAAGLAVSGQVPMALQAARLWPAAGLGLLFGVLTAVTFAWPALGRALSVTPAALFRGVTGTELRTPRGAWLLTGGTAAVVLVLLMASVPDPLFGAGFVLAVVLLLALLEGLTRGLRGLAARLQEGSAGGSAGDGAGDGAGDRVAGRARRGGRRLPVELQLALAGLHQPASPLRPALLSLGSALTLLVACTLVVTSLLRTVNETVPARAPALVFYDVQTHQLDTLRDAVHASSASAQVRTAPLVLGRLVAVNGESLLDSADPERVRDARDEQKLSTRAGNIDDVLVGRGAWWPLDYAGPPLVAMEDREAEERDLAIGDRLRFDILGRPLDVTLAAIYSQRGLQSRLWLEAIVSDGALDPFISRHVGAAYLADDLALAAQDRLAAAAPNIASVRTETMLRETRRLMARAGTGLAVVAGVCLLASLLVLGSVVAASRTRQVYDATVMHALGARLSGLRRVLYWEYALLAVVTASFAVVAGSALATALLRWRMYMDPFGLYWSGVATAVLVSAISLGLGARYLLQQMRLNPAMLLRSGG